MFKEDKKAWCSQGADAHKQTVHNMDPSDSHPQKQTQDQLIRTKNQNDLKGISYQTIVSIK